jgi:hypothetical protein
VSHSFGVIDINIPELLTVPPPSTSDPATTTTSHPEPHSSGNLEVEYASTTTDIARKEGEKLASYLWENYVEPYEFPGGIFIMGAGHAFHAVAKLISDNGMQFHDPFFFQGKPRKKAPKHRDDIPSSRIPASTSKPTQANTASPSRETENVYPTLNGVIGFIATNPIRPVSSPSNHWISQWYRDNSRIYVSNVHSMWKKIEGKASKRYGRLIRSEGTVLNQMMKMHEKDVLEWMEEKAELEESEDEGEGEGEDGMAEDGVVAAVGPAVGGEAVAAVATAMALAGGSGDVVMTTEQ